MGYKEGEWASLDLPLRLKDYSYKQGSTYPPEWRVKLLFVNGSIGDWRDKFSALQLVDLDDCLDGITGSSLTERIKSLIKPVTLKVDAAFEAVGLPKYSDMQIVLQAGDTAYPFMFDYAVGLMGPHAYGPKADPSAIASSYSLLSANNKTLADFMLGENAGTNPSIINESDSKWQVLVHNSPDDGEGNYVDTKYSGISAKLNNDTPVPDIVTGTFNPAQVANIDSLAVAGIDSVAVAKEIPIILLPLSDITEVRTTTKTEGGIKAIYHWAHIVSMTQTTTMNTVGPGFAAVGATGISFKFGGTSILDGPRIVLPDGWYLLDQTLETVEPEPPEGTPFNEMLDAAFTRLEMASTVDGNVIASAPCIIVDSSAESSLNLIAAFANNNDSYVPITPGADAINNTIPNYIKSILEELGGKAERKYVLGDSMANVYRTYLYNGGSGAQGLDDVTNFDFYSKPVAGLVGRDAIRGKPSKSTSYKINGEPYESTTDLAINTTTLSTFGMAPFDSNVPLPNTIGYDNSYQLFTATINIYLVMGDPYIGNEVITIRNPGFSLLRVSFSSIAGTAGNFAAKLLTVGSGGPGDFTIEFSAPGLKPSPDPGPGPDPVPYDPPTLDPLPDIDPAYPDSDSRPTIPEPSSPVVDQNPYGDEDRAVPDTHVPSGDFGASADPAPQPPTTIPNTPPKGYAPYIMTGTQYQNFVDYMWTSDILDAIRKVFEDPTKLILKCIRFPCDLESFAAETSSQINIGWLPEWAPGTGDVTGFKMITNLHYINFGTIVVPRYSGTFYDFAPYSTARLYLPFVGSVTLDPNEIVGHILTLKYGLNIYTGEAMALVYSSNVGLIGSYPCKIGDEVVITNRDFNDIVKALTMVAVGAGVGLTVAESAQAAIQQVGAAQASNPVNGSMMMLSENATPAPSAGLLQSTALVPAQTQAIGQARYLGFPEIYGYSDPGEASTAPNDLWKLGPTIAGAVHNGSKGNWSMGVSRSGGMSASSGLVAPLQATLYMTIPKANTSISHGAVQGYTSNIAQSLRKFTGYNEFASVQLQDVGGKMTLAEQQELMDIFTGGVVI